ncbi:UvrD-helicase domain-containing protein, partial [Nocardia suismassiliense]|uniref:UvrD-helicase domain-containing protein n=1 Tax=Nocardia suismassiliense TaxID=2077092 RepID=UPI00131F17B4
ARRAPGGLGARLAGREGLDTDEIGRGTANQRIAAISELADELTRRGLGTIRVAAVRDDEPPLATYLHDIAHSYASRRLELKRANAEGAYARPGDQRWQIPPLTTTATDPGQGKAMLARSLRAAANAASNSHDQTALTTAADALVNRSWASSGGPLAVARQLADPGIVDAADCFHEQIDDRVEALADLAEALDELGHADIKLASVTDQPILTIGTYLRTVATTYRSARMVADPETEEVDPQRYSTLDLELAAEAAPLRAAARAYGWDVAELWQDATDDRYTRQYLLRVGQDSDHGPRQYELVWAALPDGSVVFLASKSRARHLNATELSYCDPNPGIVLHQILTPAADLADPDPARNADVAALTAKEAHTQQSWLLAEGLCLPFHGTVDAEILWHRTVLALITARRDQLPPPARGDHDAARTYNDLAALHAAATDGLDLAVRASGVASLVQSPYEDGAFATLDQRAIREIFNSLHAVRTSTSRANPSTAIYQQDWSNLHATLAHSGLSPEHHQRWISLARKLVPDHLRAYLPTAPPPGIENTRTTTPSEPGPLTSQRLILGTGPARTEIALAPGYETLIDSPDAGVHLLDIGGQRFGIVDIDATRNRNLLGNGGELPFPFRVHHTCRHTHGNGSSTWVLDDVIGNARTPAQAMETLRHHQEFITEHDAHDVVADPARVRGWARDAAERNPGLPAEAVTVAAFALAYGCVVTSLTPDQHRGWTEHDGHQRYLLRISEHPALRRPRSFVLPWIHHTDGTYRYDLAHAGVSVPAVEQTILARRLFAVPRDPGAAIDALTSHPGLAVTVTELGQGWGSAETPPQAVILGPPVCRRFAERIIADTTTSSALARLAAIGNAELYRGLAGRLAADHTAGIAEELYNSTTIADPDEMGIAQRLRYYDDGPVLWEVARHVAAAVWATHSPNPATGTPDVVVDESDWASLPLTNGYYNGISEVAATADGGVVLGVRAACRHFQLDYTPDGTYRLRERNPQGGLDDLPDLSAAVQARPAHVWSVIDRYVREQDHAEAELHQHHWQTRIPAFDSWERVAAENGWDYNIERISGADGLTCWITLTRVSLRGSWQLGLPWRLDTDSQELRFQPEQAAWTITYDGESHPRPASDLAAVECLVRLAPLLDIAPATALFAAKAHAEGWTVTGPAAAGGTCTVTVACHTKRGERHYDLVWAHRHGVWEYDQKASGATHLKRPPKLEQVEADLARHGRRVPHTLDLDASQAQPAAAVEPEWAAQLPEEFVAVVRLARRSGYDVVEMPGLGGAIRDFMIEGIATAADIQHVIERRFLLRLEGGSDGYRYVEQHSRYTRKFDGAEVAFANPTLAKVRAIIGEYPTVVPATTDVDVPIRRLDAPAQPAPLHRVEAAFGSTTDQRPVSVDRVAVAEQVTAALSRWAPGEVVTSETRAAVDSVTPEWVHSLLRHRGYRPLNIVGASMWGSPFDRFDDVPTRSNTQEYWGQVTHILTELAGGVSNRNPHTGQLNVERVYTDPQRWKLVVADLAAAAHFTDTELAEIRCAADDYAHQYRRIGDVARYLVETHLHDLQSRHGYDPVHQAASTYVALHRRQVLECPPAAAERRRQERQQKVADQLREAITAYDRLDFDGAESLLDAAELIDPTWTPDDGIGAPQLRTMIGDTAPVTEKIIADAAADPRLSGFATDAGQQHYRFFAATAAAQALAALSTHRTETGEIRGQILDHARGDETLRTALITRIAQRGWRASQGGEISEDFTGALALNPEAELFAGVVGYCEDHTPIIGLHTPHQQYRLICSTVGASLHHVELYRQDGEDLIAVATVPGAAMAERMLPVLRTDLQGTAAESGTGEDPAAGAVRPSPGWFEHTRAFAGLAYPAREIAAAAAACGWDNIAPPLHPGTDLRLHLQKTLDGEDWQINLVWPVGHDGESAQPTSGFTTVGGRCDWKAPELVRALRVIQSADLGHNLARHFHRKYEAAQQARDYADADARLHSHHRDRVTIAMWQAAVLKQATDLAVTGDTGHGADQLDHATKRLASAHAAAILRARLLQSHFDGPLTGPLPRRLHDAAHAIDHLIDHAAAISAQLPDTGLVWSVAMAGRDLYRVFGAAAAREPVLAYLDAHPETEGIEPGALARAVAELRWPEPFAVGDDSSADLDHAFERIGPTVDLSERNPGYGWDVEFCVGERRYLIKKATKLGGGYTVVKLAAEDYARPGAEADELGHVREAAQILPLIRAHALSTAENTASALAAELMPEAQPRKAVEAPADPPGRQHDSQDGLSAEQRTYLTAAVSGQRNLLDDLTEVADPALYRALAPLIADQLIYTAATAAHISITSADRVALAHSIAAEAWPQSEPGGDTLAFYPAFEAFGSQVITDVDDEGDVIYELDLTLGDRPFTIRATGDPSAGYELWSHPTDEELSTGGEIIELGRVGTAEQILPTLRSWEHESTSEYACWVAPQLLPADTTATLQRAQDNGWAGEPDFAVLPRGERVLHLHLSRGAGPAAQQLKLRWDMAGTYGPYTYNPSRSTCIPRGLAPAPDLRFADVLTVLASAAPGPVTEPAGQAGTAIEPTSGPGARTGDGEQASLFDAPPQASALTQPATHEDSAAGGAAVAPVEPLSATTTSTPALDDPSAVVAELHRVEIQAREAMFAAEDAVHRDRGGRGRRVPRISERRDLMLAYREAKLARLTAQLALAQEDSDEAAALRRELEWHEPQRDSDRAAADSRQRMHTHLRELAGEVIEQLDPQQFGVLEDRIDNLTYSVHDERSDPPEDLSWRVTYHRDRLSELLTELSLPPADIAEVLRRAGAPLDTDMPGDAASEPRREDHASAAAVQAPAAPSPASTAGSAASVVVEASPGRMLDGEDYAPSAQQQAIYDPVLAGRDVKVQAAAGSGKTSTLEGLARRIALADPSTRIVYIVFNKSVQVEGSERMPGNVECRTGHSIAYRWAPDYLQQRVQNNSNDPAKKALRFPEDIADHLGIVDELVTDDNDVMGPAEQALAVMRTVEVYANSADDSISRHHLPPRVRSLAPTIQDRMVAIAGRAWADLSDRNGRLRLNNDHVRKMWALARPDLTQPGWGLTPATVLFLDEAQDTPPVLARVISEQTMRKVLVGDQDQAIYGWTGAIDYLRTATADLELPLTTSWRFGPQIADLANRYLQLLGSDKRVIGGGADSEILPESSMSGADAILVRSNGAALEEIERELAAGRSVGVPTGTKADLRSVVDTARYLQGKGRPPWRGMHDDLVQFNTWAQAQTAAERGDDPKVTMLVRLIDKRGINELSELIDQLREVGKPLEGIDFRDYPVGLVAEGEGTFAAKDHLSRAGFRYRPHPSGRLHQAGSKMGKPIHAWIAAGGPARRQAILARARELAAKHDYVDVMVSTAHKAKGLEWDRVRIGRDFKGPTIDPGTGELTMPGPEELRLAYVAVTRARKHLDPGSLSYVYDHTDPDGGLPGTAPQIHAHTTAPADARTNRASAAELAHAELIQPDPAASAYTQVLMSIETGSDAADLINAAAAHPSIADFAADADPNDYWLLGATAAEQALLDTVVAWHADANQSPARETLCRAVREDARARAALTARVTAQAWRGAHAVADEQYWPPALGLDADTERFLGITSTNDAGAVLIGVHAGGHRYTLTRDDRSGEYTVYYGDGFDQVLHLLVAGEAPDALAALRGDLRTRDIPARPDPAVYEQRREYVSLPSPVRQIAAAAAACGWNHHTDTRDGLLWLELEGGVAIESRALLPMRISMAWAPQPGGGYRYLPNRIRGEIDGRTTGFTTLHRVLQLLQSTDPNQDLADYFSRGYQLASARALSAARASTSANVREMRLDVAEAEASVLAVQARLAFDDTDDTHSVRRTMIDTDTTRLETHRAATLFARITAAFDDDAIGPARTDHPDIATAARTLAWRVAAMPADTDTWLTEFADTLTGLDVHRDQVAAAVWAVDEMADQLLSPPAPPELPAGRAVPVELIETATAAHRRGYQVIYGWPGRYADRLVVLELLTGPGPDYSAITAYWESTPEGEAVFDSEQSSITTVDASGEHTTRNITLEQILDAVHGTAAQAATTPVQEAETASGSTELTPAGDTPAADGVEPSAHLAPTAGFGEDSSEARHQLGELISAERRARIYLTRAHTGLSARWPLTYLQGRYLAARQARLETHRGIVTDPAEQGRLDRQLSTTQAARQHNTEFETARTELVAWTAQPAAWTYLSGEHLQAAQEAVHAALEAVAAGQTGDTAQRQHMEQVFGAVQGRHWDGSHAVQQAVSRLDYIEFTYRTADFDVIESGSPVLGDAPAEAEEFAIMAAVLGGTPTGAWEHPATGYPSYRLTLHDPSAPSELRLELCWEHTDDGTVYRPGSSRVVEDGKVQVLLTRTDAMDRYLRGEYLRPAGVTALTDQQQADLLYAALRRFPLDSTLHRLAFDAHTGLYAALAGAAANQSLREILDRFLDRPGSVSRPRTSTGAELAALAATAIESDPLRIRLAQQAAALVWHGQLHPAGSGAMSSMEADFEATDWTDLPVDVLDFDRGERIEFVLVPSPISNEVRITIGGKTFRITGNTIHAEGDREFPAPMTR